QLRERGPVGVLFHASANIRIGQHVDGLVLRDQGVEDVHEGRREAALREASRSLHEQYDRVGLDQGIELLANLRVQRHPRPISMKSPVEKLAIRVVGTIADIEASAWDALDHGPSPFLRHGFLRALEESGSTDPATSKKRRSGWSGLYLLAEQGGRLVGGVPAF